MKLPAQVAGAAGAGPADKTGKVAGAAGGGDSAAGAGALGGGPPGSMASILESLKAVVAKLADAVQKMGTSGGGANKAGGCGGGGKPGQAAVQGVQGEGATAEQFVKPLERAVAAGGNEDDKFEQRVLELINEYRATRGLRAVAYNPMVDAAAEKHASHMAKVGRMAHDGIGDGDPGERIRAEGFRKSWGENVATGQTSPEQVVREWIASPAHLRNIVDPNFTQMGVGFVTGANGRSYWAQEFGG